MKKLFVIIIIAAVAAYAADRWSGGELRGRAEAALGLVVGSSEAKLETPADKGAGSNGGAAGAPGGARSGRGSGGPKSVAVVAAVEKDLSIRRQTIGSVLSEASLSVTSHVQGMLVERVAREGSDVKPGDVIARLDSRTAAAADDKDKALLSRDAANLQAANDNLARQQKLAQSNVATGQALQDAKTAVLTAQATIELDQATLDTDTITLGDMDIRAPIAGRLGAYAVAVGNYIQPGGAIVSLTQMAPVDVSFTLPESDINTLRQVGSLSDITVQVTPTTTTSVSDGAEPGSVSTTDGKLSFIDSQIDPQSGTFLAKATMGNEDLSLWPGQSVTVAVVLGGRKLVAVPTLAVQPAQQGPIVYVVDADDKIDVRQVTVGVVDGDMTGVTEGLKAGDRVVTEGQMNLTSGLKVKVAGDARPGAGKTEASKAGASTPDAGGPAGTPVADASAPAAGDGDGAGSTDPAAPADASGKKHHRKSETTP